jgi:hypothetical protein
MSVSSSEEIQTLYTAAEYPLQKRELPSAPRD